MNLEHLIRSENSMGGITKDQQWRNKNLETCQSTKKKKYVNSNKMFEFDNNNEKNN